MTTMLGAQSVGSSCLLITSPFSKHASSPFSLSSRVRGTRQGGMIEGKALINFQVKSLFFTTIACSGFCFETFTMNLPFQLEQGSQFQVDLFQAQ